MKHEQIIAILAAARKRFNLPSRSLAHRIGYDHTGICKWEKESNSPSLRAAIDWADALGLEIVLQKKGERPREGNKLDSGPLPTGDNRG